MRSSAIVVATSYFLQRATAQAYDPNRPVQFVNLVNLLWELPRGDNLTRGLGASVVNVDSTAITYAVSCDATAELVPGPTPISCFWETVGPQLFTQWDTSLHFTLTTSGFDKVASFEGDYSYQSTLAPTITGAFSISTSEAGSTRTDVYAGTTTDVTWFPIPITAGEEKLAAAFTSSTRTLSPTTSLPSALTSSSGALPTWTGGSETRSSRSQTENVSMSMSPGTQNSSGGSSTGTASQPVVTSMVSTSLGGAGNEAPATSPGVTSSTVAAAAGQAGGNAGWVGAVVAAALGVLFL